MQKRMFGSGTFVWIPIKQNSSYPNRMDPIRNTAINPFCDLFPVTSVSDPDPSEIRI